MTKDLIMFRALEMKITIAEWRAMADVPNTEGFQLLGLRARAGQWTTDILTVRKGEDGCHYLSAEGVSHVHPVMYSGWKPLE